MKLSHLFHMSKTRIAVFIIQFSEIILPMTQCLRKGFHVFSWVGSLPRSCGLRPATIMPPPIQLFCRHRYCFPPNDVANNAAAATTAGASLPYFFTGILLPTPHHFLEFHETLGHGCCHRRTRRCSRLIRKGHAIFRFGSRAGSRG